MSSSLFSSLNPQQLKAVTHPPETPIQILAGPGSGKTKVLTCRIAHLTLDYNLDPSSICAVTFTNKAANEMRERLKKLIGIEATSKLAMGTFHAICALFLRRHAKLIDLNPNYTICDAEESKKIITGLLKRFQSLLEERDITLREGNVLSVISKFKAKGRSASDVLDELKPSHPGRGSSAKNEELATERIIAEVYRDYEKVLKKANSLDFDDLLLYGVKLFSGHKKTVRWCKHILVDEFQDTNTMQYQLMTAIASNNKCVSIVGDPDQSIYGWRSAEVENLTKMCAEFSNVVQVFLEQNYRSTGSILATSLAIISQDNGRIAKSLRTTHPWGCTPVMSCLESEYMEAWHIAREIKRVKAYMGGAMNWGDFVILLRFNALSRTLESALQKEGIPNRILGGHKFFERLEIKDLLAYLQLVDNPSYDPAFKRAVNVPARGIGEKTLSEIENRAAMLKVSQVRVVERICASEIPDIKPPVKKKLVPFVKAIRVLRELATKRTSPADLIRKLLDLIEYHDHLKKAQSDWETRWENVQELINFASDMESTAQIQVPEDDDPSVREQGDHGDTPLRLFLHASLLSSEGDNKEEDSGSQEKVTITTCHAAKGLEWPVVFVPGVEKGIFPFYRTESVEEERRLLYVACTRAQAMLYLSRAEKRKVSGESKSKELSEFISAIPKAEKQSLFSNVPSSITDAIRGEICMLLDRKIPDPQEASRVVSEYVRSTQRQSSLPQGQEDAMGHQLQASFTTPNKSVSLTMCFTSSSAVVSRNGAIPVQGSIPPPIGSSNYQARNFGRNIQQQVICPVTSAPARVQQTYTGSKPHTKINHPTNATSPWHVRSSVLSTASEAYVGTASQSSTPTPESSSQDPPTANPRKRLGMGNRTAGYANKKFKPMQPSR